MPELNLPPLQGAVRYDDGHSQPRYLCTAEQLTARARMAISAAHPHAPAGRLPDLPAPDGRTGTGGARQDLFTAQAAHQYTAHALEVWVDPRDVELEELREKIAYLRQGCMDATRDELITRITAVGSAEWAAGHFLSAVRRQVRDRTIAEFTAVEAGRTRSELITLLAAHPYRRELRDCGSSDCAWASWPMTLPPVEHYRAYAAHLADVLLGNDPTTPTTNITERT